MFKIWELNQDWIDNVDGATCKFLEDIDAKSLAEAAKLAQEKYPGQPLRVAGDNFAVEMEADAKFDETLLH